MPLQLTLVMGWWRWCLGNCFCLQRLSATNTVLMHVLSLWSLSLSSKLIEPLDITMHFSQGRALHFCTRLLFISDKCFGATLSLFCRVDNKSFTSCNVPMLSYNVPETLKHKSLYSIRIRLWKKVPYYNTLIWVSKKALYLSKMWYNGYLITFL